jgi:FKBP12-rapamycin complex-associated protein
VSFALIYGATPEKTFLNHIVGGVFRSVSCPSYIVRSFLAVLEIFEVLEVDRPVDARLQARKATEANFLAQAVRLYEDVLSRTREPGVIDALVSLNQQLGLPLAAHGVLTFCGDTRSQAQLFERLGMWAEALNAYSGGKESNPDGVKNCLRALSRFSELKKVAKSGYYLAAALWHLFDHKTFLPVASKLPDNEQNKFFILMAMVMQNNFEKAEGLINDIRAASVKTIFPIIGEDYERVYNEFAEISYLAEVQEVIDYKRIKAKLTPTANQETISSSNDAIDRIILTWDTRFGQLANVPQVLHGHLCIRSMVLSIADQRSAFLTFLKVSLENHLVEAVESVLAVCTAQDPCDDYAIMKCRLMWERGEKDEALNAISALRQSPKTIFLKSQWLFTQNSLKEARDMLMPLTASEGSDPHVWEIWSKVNLSLYDKTHETSQLLDAFQGVANGLLLSLHNSLTYTLRILRIIFEYNASEIFNAFTSRLAEFPVAVWIPVLPQILSRLATDSVDVREIVAKLVISVGLCHPHAVLFPLIVACSIVNTERQRSAAAIMDKLRSSHPDAVENVCRFASELERISVTWWEILVGEIDEASRAYATRGDINEMLSIMAGVNKLNAKEATSFYEIAFVRAYGSDLKLAEYWWNVFSQVRDEPALHSLWHYYTTVFYAIRPFTRELTTINLADASPYFAGMKSCEVPVPGTYSPNGQITVVNSIGDELVVIESKQRPRRMRMTGSDGVQYTFLLKAHEDTRLDERVMQLFSFINTFVENSTLPLRSKLSITTYKVIPITTEVGLIGWLPNCQTVFDVVSQYRQRKGIPLETEFQHVLGIAPQFDNLTLVQQVKAFQSGYKMCDGLDLKTMLFRRSADSVDWLDRRTNFTASLSMTSMAGYLLGLGDRHMCNIMMNNRTAKLVHIDFGDCFEVAQHRDKYPEKVPFRLTRLLVNSLEIAGVKGTFRSLCLNIMSLLRANADQIVGLLSVFTYDPLKQWDISGTEIKAAAKDEPAAIMKRIGDKLTGNDFNGMVDLSVEAQVDELIDEATSVENLAVMFKGWYPWW